MRTATGRLLGSVTGFIFLFLSPILLFGLQDQKIKDIYEPVFVGRPNNNAFNGLVQLPDGELRHYGFEGSWFDSSRHTYYYIYSSDHGLTWERQITEIPDHFTSENSPPAARSPHSGDFIRVISTREGTFVMRSTRGIDGPYQKSLIDPLPISMIRQPTPLPEEDRTGDTTLHEEQKTGETWEDVFTNRDVLHAAISDDDGKTWKGFREIYLNPLRNEADFATIGGTQVSLDKSVHQSQAKELTHGKVLLALGQHPTVRAMIIFDPDWLYETGREDNFSDGLDSWTTFKYVEGIKGHCAYDRHPGPHLVDHPDIEDRKVLRIRHLPDDELVCSVDGAVWNFPAAGKGSFTMRIMLKPGGKGDRLSLMDRWFNPTDTLAYRYAMYTIDFGGEGMIDHKPLQRSGDRVFQDGGPTGRHALLPPGGMGEYQV